MRAQTRWWIAWAPPASRVRPSAQRRQCLARPCGGSGALTPAWPLAHPFAPSVDPVVEAYSESWGPCGSVAPLMRKFILEVAPPAKALQVLVVRPACKRRNARRRGFAAARRAPLASRAALRRRFRGARSARRRGTRCWRSSATRRCRTFCFSATAICATPSWAQTSPRWSACCASTSPSPKTRWSTPRCGAGSCFRVAFAFAQFR